MTSLLIFDLIEHFQICLHCIYRMEFYFWQLLYIFDLTMYFYIMYIIYLHNLILFEHRCLFLFQSSIFRYCLHHKNPIFRWNDTKFRIFTFTWMYYVSNNLSNRKFFWEIIFEVKNEKNPYWVYLSTAGLIRFIIGTKFLNFRTPN